MPGLAQIAQQIDVSAQRWAQLAVANAWAIDATDENARFRRALLDVAVAVLSSDGPLNAYESLFLKELFATEDGVERAEVRAKSGGSLLAESMPTLIRAVQGFAFNDPDYRPDQDPVVTTINAVLDAGLAADKFPSEAEAWAASRVLGKLRQASLAEPEEPASAIAVKPFDRAPAAPAHRDPPTLPTPPPPPANPSPEPLEPMVEQLIEEPPLAREFAADSNIQALLTELHTLVGLHGVKEQVETLVNLAKVRALRAERGLPSPDISFHLVFSGNPGTGKTTVARILGRIYGALGLLTVGKCIEVDRSALIGQYLGQTTTKTAAVLEKSLGSVLFLDEAYSLTEGDQNQYGDEAVSVILKFMEDHRRNFVLIAAGYTEQMDRFVRSNPGLKSRFSRVVEFPDYSADELAQIFVRMCRADGYNLARDAQPRLRHLITALVDPKPAEFANAREVRKLYERSVERHANRLADTHCSNEELSLLTEADLPLAAI